MNSFQIKDKFLVFIAVCVITNFIGACSVQGREIQNRPQITLTANTAIPTEIVESNPTVTNNASPIPTGTPTIIVKVVENKILTSSPTVIHSDLPQVITPIAVGQNAQATLTIIKANEISPTKTPLPKVEEESFELTSTPSLFYIFPIQPPEKADYIAGHHDYPATDIVAPCGTEFVAVIGGVIDETSQIDVWNPNTNDPAQRGGKYVSLIGQDGVRYYGSHLENVAPGIEAGVEVGAGTILGYVGNSGNARGLLCHVHFGISYPTFAGDWEIRRGVVSPFPYLQAWEKGEQITPDLNESN